jgi:hypothetical protein
MIKEMEKEISNLSSCPTRRLSWSGKEKMEVKTDFN